MKTNAEKGTIKAAAIDSSSVILLHKAALLQSLLSCYRVVVAESVFTELTGVQKRDAKILKALLGGLVCTVDSSQCPTAMGAGESGTIALFKAGIGDFIIIDDRRAANYCYAHKIPFVSSLLLPRILCLAGVIGHDEQNRAAAILESEGYYSASILSRAKSFPDAELKRFCSAIV